MIASAPETAGAAYDVPEMDDATLQCTTDAVFVVFTSTDSIFWAGATSKGAIRPSSVGPALEKAAACSY